MKAIYCSAAIVTLILGLANVQAVPGADAPSDKAPVDGPQLKAAAEHVLDQCDEVARQKPGSDEQRQTIDFDPVLVYLHNHPDDKETHHRAVEVLKQFCRARDSGPSKFAAVARARWFIVPYVWAALQQLGELKTGMTREQTVELLGPPWNPRPSFGGGAGAGAADTKAAQQNPDKLVWQSFMRPGFENPLGVALEAQLQDGKTTAWKIHWPGEFGGKVPYGMPAD